MHVTSLPVNYPLKNTSIVPALYTFGKSTSVMQFAYHVHFPASSRKTRKNEKYRTFSHMYRLFTYYSKKERFGLLLDTFPIP